MNKQSDSMQPCFTPSTRCSYIEPFAYNCMHGHNICLLPVILIMSHVERGIFDHCQTIDWHAYIIPHGNYFSLLITTVATAEFLTTIQLHKPIGWQKLVSICLITHRATYDVNKQPRIRESSTMTINYIPSESRTAFS